MALVTVRSVPGCVRMVSASPPMSLSVQAGTQSAPSPCSKRPSVPAEKALVRRERDERAARPGGAADVRFGPSSAPSSWLERMAPPGELLFSHAVHGGHGPSPGTGSLCSPALRTRIEDFVTTS